MSFETKPFFIVGCGRSGTQALAQLFASFDDIEMHHEYMVHLTQPLGTKYYHGLVNRECVLSTLQDIYKGALHYSDFRIWGDSSNKLSWMMEEMAELFPQAKFIHVVRDGRKVTSSLFHKLGGECLDDYSANVFADYLRTSSGHAVCPPPEKKYWWPQVNADEKAAGEYQKLDHFGRIAYHWAQLNACVENQLSKLPKHQCLQVRLEDITSNQECLFEMIDFIGMEPTKQHFEMMQRPHNVVRPENNPLTESQLTVFWKYCSELMKKYGYLGTEEYELDYNSTMTINAKSSDLR